MRWPRARPDARQPTRARRAGRRTREPSPPSGTGRDRPAPPSAGPPDRGRAISAPGCDRARQPSVSGAGRLQSGSHRALTPGNRVVPPNQACWDRRRYHRSRRRDDAPGKRGGRGAALITGDDADASESGTTPTAGSRGGSADSDRDNRQNPVEVRIRRLRNAPVKQEAEVIADP